MAIIRSSLVVVRSGFVFPHSHLVIVEELLCLQYMENTKVTPVKSTVASLLCFQHFQLVLLEELLCFPYIENTKAPINKNPKRCYFCVLSLLLLLCFMLHSHSTWPKFQSKIKSVQKLMNNMVIYSKRMLSNKIIK